MRNEHCQGYVPSDILRRYWTLTDEEKASAFDMLMRSTSSNLFNYPEVKEDEAMEYVVITESGEQWDNCLTLKEAKQCLEDKEEIGEGELTYRKMTDEERGNAQ